MGKQQFEFDIEIDRLTNSIENVETGEVFDTEITLLTPKNFQQIKISEWLFEWHDELRDKTKDVYKLTTANNPMIIQGLISIQRMTDHFFMHLIESANFNKGKNKVYRGVPGNLVAFACRTSFEAGFEGFVAFNSKTSLIKHYQQTLGATHLSGLRMFIETSAAHKLVSKYFSN